MNKKLTDKLKQWLESFRKSRSESSFEDDLDQDLDPLEDGSTEEIDPKKLGKKAQKKDGPASEQDLLQQEWLEDTTLNWRDKSFSRLDQWKKQWKATLPGHMEKGKEILRQLPEKLRQLWSSLRQNGMQNLNLRHGHKHWPPRWLQNINYEAFFLRLFQPETRPHIHRIFLVSLLVLISYLSGKQLALVLQIGSLPRPQLQNITMTPPSQDKTLAGLQLIKQTDPFRTKVQEEGKSKSKTATPQTLVCKDSDHKTTLPIKLVNSIIMQNPAKSIISLDISSGELLTVRKGEKVQDMAEITKITPQKIILKNLRSLQCEFIPVEREEDKIKGERLAVLSPQQGRKLLQSQKMTGISNQGNHYNISKNLIGSKLQDINTILTQARAIQIPNPDGTLAFKVTEIVPGSIFSYLGIENDDQITEINGQKIRGLNEVMNLFGTIQELEKLSLTVIKNDGTQQTLDYEFNK